MGVTPIGYPSLTQADVRAIRDRSEDLVEGTNAFAEKRNAAFKGR